MRAWRCRDTLLPVHERVHLMGVLNVTPDSFSDGGLYASTEAAVGRARQMVEEGADLIDVGGESTRPGADPVPLSEELERVVPVIGEVVDQTGAPVSVDTTKSEVARAALDAGAVIINDVSALRFDPKMTEVVAESGAGVVLMHMLGDPRTMQANPTYRDVVAEVRDALLEWANKAEAHGISQDRIVIDPGIGFGKTKEHNLTLLKSIGSLTENGYHVLVGPSRKSFIGATLDVALEDRLEGTAAAVAWVVMAGANIVRVHDVKQMARVVRMIEAIRSA